MISHQSSKRRRRKLIAIIGIAVALVVVLQTPLRGIGGSLLALVDRPLKQARTFISDSVRVAGDLLSSDKSLREERDAARAEFERVSAELASYMARTPDMELLKVLRTDSSERTVASVLMVPPQSPYDSLVIDRGSLHGIMEGALVFGQHDRPLGTVVRAEKRTSIVAPFSTPGVVSHVFVRGPNVHAKAIGAGGGVIEVFIPEGVVAHVGDTVIMPTLSGEEIGTLEHVASDPTEPGTIGSLVPDTSLRSLRFVSISRDVFHTPSHEEILNYIGAHTTSTALMFSLPESFSTTTSTTTL